jgi:hypothetical protein
LSPENREVFVSYRRLDDEPPPGRLNERGFVRYLLKQVRYDLGQMGVPDALLWQDRAQIEKGDVWSEAIFSALNKAELFVAILSRNYITSSWCERELSTMASRMARLGAHAGKRRIFRVDKHSVPEHEIPEVLRGIESVRFYSEDNETKRVDEFYWRGKVRHPRDYENAVRELAEAICKRLDELGISCQPQPQPPPLPSDYNALPSNGRVIFVAKPASDMVEPYRTLVRELQSTGYRVTPDCDKDLGKLGEEVQSAVVNALAEAEASIHLLGERTGGRPDGLHIDLVTMQLMAAADEASKRTGFKRMIWAPAVLLSGAFTEAEIARRDPLSVVDGFGKRLPTDQIVGDTASRFNEFVLQRLERLGSNHSNQSTERNVVYIRPPGRNRQFGVAIAIELKRVGFEPVLNPSPPVTKDQLARVEQKHFREARHVVACWGSQCEAKILAEIDTIHSWKTARPKSAGSKLILLLTSPSTKAKAEVLALGNPYVDHIVDASKCEDAALIAEKLVSALG